MITTIMAVASLPLGIICFVLWRCYTYMLSKWREECIAHRITLQDTLRERVYLENQLDGKKLDAVMQQTRIFGNAKTETLIAEWLEDQWSPLGDDLTDFENTKQIAARIRRGEYLNELVSSENKQAVRRNAS